MDKRLRIIILTALTVVIVPLLVVGFILKSSGKLLDIAGWLCWMEPRMAHRGWKELKQEIKESWDIN